MAIESRDVKLPVNVKCFNVILRFDNILAKIDLTVLLTNRLKKAKNIFYKKRLFPSKK